MSDDQEPLGRRHRVLDPQRRPRPATHDPPVVAGRPPVGAREPRVVEVDHVEPERLAHGQRQPLALQHADVEAEARVGGGVQRRPLGELQRQRVVVVGHAPADRRVLLGVDQRRDAVDPHHEVDDPAAVVQHVVADVAPVPSNRSAARTSGDDELAVAREQDVRLGLGQRLPVLGRLGRERHLRDPSARVARDVPLEVLVLREPVLARLERRLAVVAVVDDQVRAREPRPGVRRLPHRRQPYHAGIDELTAVGRCGVLQEPRHAPVPVVIERRAGRRVAQRARRVEARHQRHVARDGITASGAALQRRMTPIDYDDELEAVDPGYRYVLKRRGSATSGCACRCEDEQRGGERGEQEGVHAGEDAPAPPVRGRNPPAAPC